MAKITINGKEIECEAGETIMRVAQANDIFIPSLCDHPDFKVKANCRTCVVEIEGRKNLSTSCSVKVEDGMKIRTDSDRVKQARNLNIELLFAEHIERCPTCIWRVNCKLLDLADRYKILISRFKDRKGSRQVYKFANAIEIDGTQCIDCRNCIDACSKLQGIGYLKIKGKGTDQEIVPAEDDKTDCIYCGQCSLHCPVGAAQEQAGWYEVEKALREGNKIMAAQISHSSLAAIGEEFKEEANDDFYARIIGALRQLGFEYVFDNNAGVFSVAAGNAKELMKIRRKKPLLTSSCPAWVKYADFYHPELKPFMAKSASPFLEGGRSIKKFLSKKISAGIDNISVALITPCTANKYEILSKDGISVDHAITTRELAWLIKKNKIELNSVEQSEFDKLDVKNFSSPNFGWSGAETELVFNIAKSLAKAEKNDNLSKDFALENYDEKEGIREIEYESGGKKLTACVVNGIGNIGKVLDDVKKYDFIEVMACPGGCAGGGGQPIPTTEKLREERIESIKKMKN